MDCTYHVDIRIPRTPRPPQPRPDHQGLPGVSHESRGFFVLGEVEAADDGASQTAGAPQRACVCKPALLEPLSCEWRLTIIAVPKRVAEDVNHVRPELFEDGDNSDAILEGVCAILCHMQR